MGYLLVLQAFDDDEEGHNSHIEDYVVRLFRLASRKGDWELCTELSRFLIALDGSGDMLRNTVSRIGLRNGNVVGGGSGSGTGTSTSMSERPGGGRLMLTVPSTNTGSGSGSGSGPRSWSSLSTRDDDHADMSATSSVNSGEPSDIASISPIAENSGGE